ncbi:MAG: alpha/beta fold hydrolase [Lutibacter sp.]|uniref:alpha/beta fold hydrolase n=1 Tax=Lutibacter sp. TaxID=1925666 RepID=UPI001A063834|nr:alpha/beta hydrolase [Lutibacter sp.]NOR27278.1 alpha/beta fold hydrolase [Lutibacter sp.]
MKTDKITKTNQLLVTKTVKLKKNNSIIRYAELGNKSKPTILLLHGVPENLQAWYAVAPMLSNNNHVLALDWPGFGGSEPLNSLDAYNSQNFANIVTDFMDTMKVNKTIILASDIALLPAFLIGLKHPKLVSKLIVMDGIPFPRKQYASWELNSFARKGSIIGKALVRWFPAVAAQTAYLKGFYRGHSIPKEVRKEFSIDGKNKNTQDAFLSYFQNFHIGQTYFETVAHKLQIPVLVVWGKYDRFINIKLGHEIVEKLPNAELKIIDKSGHYVHMDKPEALVKAATEFIELNP